MYHPTTPKSQGPQAGQHLETRTRAAQPRAHQEKNGTRPFLIHGLGTHKKKGGGNWSPYLPPHLGRVCFTREPSLAGIPEEEAIYCRRKWSWEQDQYMYGCEVYARHTDTWPGKQCPGSAQNKGTFYSLASDQLMGYYYWPW